MSRLSKTQNYAILWLNSQGLEALKIADELKLTEKQVLSVLEKGIDKKVSENSSVKTAKSPVNSRSKNLMITQTAGKKTKNVAIMTQEASQINDELKKNYNSSSSRYKENIIYRPNG